MTITLAEYRMLEARGLITRPLTELMYPDSAGIGATTTGRRVHDANASTFVTPQPRRQLDPTLERAQRKVSRREARRRELDRQATRRVELALVEPGAVLPARAPARHNGGVRHGEK